MLAAAPMELLPPQVQCSSLRGVDAGSPAGARRPQHAQRRPSPSAHHAACTAPGPPASLASLSPYVMDPCCSGGGRAGEGGPGPPGVPCGALGQEAGRQAAGQARQPAPLAARGGGLPAAAGGARLAQAARAGCLPREGCRCTCGPGLARAQGTHGARLFGELKGALGEGAAAWAPALWSQNGGAHQADRAEKAQSHTGTRLVPACVC